MEILKIIYYQIESLAKTDNSDCNYCDETYVFSGIDYCGNSNNIPKEIIMK